VRAAYRAAARSRHPDAGGSPEDMQSVNAAWHVLRDPGRRAAYDRSLRDAGQWSGDPAPGGTVDPDADGDEEWTDRLDLLDGRPVREVRALEGWWALAPPGVLLAGIGLALGALVLASPALLVFAAAALFVAFGLFVLAPLRAMTGPRRGGGGYRVPPMAATYLDRIVAAHRAAAAADERPLDGLVERAASQPPARGFAAALAGDGGLAVIAEIKRRSPAKGGLRPDLDPVTVARAYASGGAACLSVLTDEGFFGGSATDLAAARAAVGIPVLRKDFTVAAADVCDTRLMGADAVLLIVAALDDAELRDLHALAGQVGLDALVEVHDEAELERALAVDPRLVGVNQRDLVSFQVDPERARRVVKAIPPGIVRVAESGIAGPGDAAALRDAGFDAVLVGESLVTAPDPAAAVAALRQA
jgi:indole-3-glycerol phosphate synthase